MMPADGLRAEKHIRRLCREVGELGTNRRRIGNFSHFERLEKRAEGGFQSHGKPYSCHPSVCKEVRRISITKLLTYACKSQISTHLGVVARKQGGIVCLWRCWSHTREIAREIRESGEIGLPLF